MKKFLHDNSLSIVLFVFFLILSIFLRQRKSPESKAIGDPDSKTSH